MTAQQAIGILLVSLSLLSGANGPGTETHDGNPLLGEYRTPFETPPFDRIRAEHFLPAFLEAIRRHDAEIRTIVANREIPTFENTIVSLERSGSLLARVENLFSNMLGACPSEGLVKLADQIFPLLTRHKGAVMMDTALFRRIRSVYEERNGLNLDDEQKTLLEKQYRGYVRSGALLDQAQKAELSKIDEELSRLTQAFGAHFFREKNAYSMILEREEDLAGLPQSVVDAGAATAGRLGHRGKWAFTLQGASLLPFLTYSQNRALREKLYKASVDLGRQDNEFNNEGLVVAIANLRSKKARLLGYPSYAHYILAEDMAGRPETVYGLLKRIWTAALNKAQREAAELQAFIDRDERDISLAPWDWAFYAEKIKSAGNILDEQAIRPFFMLEDVRDGAFYVAKELFGVSFEERRDLPRYGDDVQAFEVKDADGSHLGIFYADYTSRPGKIYSGYMNYYRRQSRRDGRRISPVICNVENFARPAAGPVLLSLDEVRILFHEFGHALHELLSNVSYESLSGTSTEKDFTEMPSRFMERWALLPDILRIYAKHYQTRQTIPEELIGKIQTAVRMNQGYDVVQFAASSFLDMDWHTIEKPEERSCRAFENAVMARIGIIPEIDPRYRSPSFIHVFSGSYSAQYYSYLWSEVLAADAFEAFQGAGLFDPGTAAAFRKNILEKGGSEDAGILFCRFRGRTAGIGPFLRARGLSETGQ